MGILKGKTEQERTDEFEEMVGRDRAWRLQRIWFDSHPAPMETDKTPRFKENARKNGYTEREIEAFLELT